MKLNKGALKLCAVYTVYCFALTALGCFVSDFKGQLFLNSLAYLPALLPFCWLGLDQTVGPHSWINSVFFFYPASLVVVYWFGATISALRRLLTRLQEPSAPIDDDPPGWRPH
jgi:ABC-type sulfate transport system permease component